MNNPKSEKPLKARKSKRFRLKSLDANEIELVTFWLLTTTISETQTRIASEKEGGLAAWVPRAELEDFYVEYQRKYLERIQRDQQKLVEAVKADEELKRKLEFAVFSGVQEKMMKLLTSENPDASEVKIYAMLLLESRKQDLVELKTKAALQGSGPEKELTEEQKMEQAWNVFGLPEEERERRRKIWRKQLAEAAGETEAKEAEQL